MHSHIDDIDINILELLQSNSRIKRYKIAEIIGLSVPSVTERLKKLEKNGIIEAYITKLNHKLLNKDITAFIFVVSESSKHYNELVEQAKMLPEILECHAVTGDGSHILKVRTDSTSSLENLLSKIQAIKGVRSTRTSIVLSTFKEGYFLNLNNLKQSTHKV